MRINLIIISIFFSNITLATEYIVELKNGLTPSPLLVKLAQRNFNVLGKEYIIINQKISAKKFNEISLIEENFPVELFNTDVYSPDVVDFSKQWAFENKGNNEPVSLDQMSPVKGVKGADLNMLKAWNITKGHKDVVIAVIDTGVKWDHPELKSNMWVNSLEKNGQKGIDDDGNGYIDDIYGYDFSENDSDPMDEYGHGTHCAGIIGATHESGKIAGVMNKVSLMAVRMMDHKGRGKTEQSIKAVGYAVENGADVLSNSWGSRRHSKILEGILSKANDMGIVVVAAAGNSRFNDNDKIPTYPANYQVENIISVAAFNARDRHSAYSSYGKKTVHVAAPGTNIISTYIKKKRKKEIYKVASGTSMAAPYISGLVGLLLSITNEYTPLEIKQRLITTSVPVAHMEDKSVSGGRVNAESFLNITN
ncbi:MAG: S8 family serine peptidase [Halobacteriovoraceae bacterium]|jgi:thermitase|nr:S8 family serine peptidase [Halobacteriovoraceae bacterium]